MDSLKLKLIKVFGHVGERLELELAPDAKEFYHHWYMNIENSVHAKRLDTYALRLMPLLAVNDLKKEVDLVTVKKAVAIFDWQLLPVHDPASSFPS